MKFNKILFILLACILAFAAANPEPKFRPFKKLEKLGQRVRDGLIKAGPAIKVIGDAQSIIKGAKG